MPTAALLVAGMHKTTIDVAFGLAGGGASGQAPPARAFVPYSDPPINYLSADVDDPVARLQSRIEKGEVSLAYEPRRGYLDSALKLLEIPVSSQALSLP